METWQRDYDRMLAAGPPEDPLFTADYTTAVIVENGQSTATEVMAWLRERLGKEATITGDHDENGLYFHITDEVEGVTDEDDAEAAFHALIEGNTFELVMDGFEVDDPYDDEPDWDAIEKDRRIEEDWA